MFSCDQCQFVTKSLSVLKVHKKYDHGMIKKLECHCGKLFKYTGALNQHKKKSHLKENKQICTVCNKGYPTPFQLKVSL